MKRIRLFIVPIVLACFLLSCAQLGITTDYASMTPKQKVSFYMATYNRQYESYKLDVKPNLTDDQKKVLVIRKSVMTEVYPLITAYDFAQTSGKPLGSAEEQAIMLLFNKLSTYIK
jgi:hypothetical protein